jgi:predicted DNA-binding transcriptional regulator AlpA
MTTTNNHFQELLNEHEVARVTGLSVASIRRWRLLQHGPKFLKLGSAVRYKPEDLAMWLASRPSGGWNRESEPQGQRGKL